ncbi:MAG: NAD-binding protein [Acidimicrobiia bacterium]
MRLIVVGAGGTARDLVRRLGDRWDVTLVDSDPGSLEQAARGRRVHRVVGDGSTRPVLEQAGLGEADTLVAATDDDSANMAACRVALEARLPTVTAVAAEPEQLDAYRDLEVPAIAPDRLTARRIVAGLESRRVFSAGLAEGMAEAIEFRIAADSPLRDKALRELDSERWLLVAILRRDRLIVPHGDTVLEPGDRVTVVGAAADFSLIVDTFTSGEARFPIDFGAQVAVALESEHDLEGPVAEAIGLARSSSAQGLLVVYRDPDTIPPGSETADPDRLLERLERLADGVPVRALAVDASPAGMLTAAARLESVGVIVIPPPDGEQIGRGRGIELLRSVGKVGVPALFSRGTHPYRRVVVPARDTPAGRSAARAAIDLVDYGTATLVVVAVVAFGFAGGGFSQAEAMHAVSRLQEEAAVRGVGMKHLIRQGNPVRVIEETVGADGLLVLGMPRRSPTLLTPGIVGHLVRRSGSSVLVVPSQE